MSFQYVRSILSDELCKIGGELFAKEAAKIAAMARAASGDEKAKADLEIAEFARKLLSGMIAPGDSKQERFQEILNALALLSDAELAG